MKRILILLFVFFSGSIAFSQKAVRKLERGIRSAINGYGGDIGIYVKDLRNGKTISINADTIFPTASIVKVTILLGLMDKINSGELNYDSAFVYKDSLLYEGSDILGSFKNNESILL